MKLEPPLSNLIARCQTICVAECCGVDAYDFSPVQIASYLTMFEGLPNSLELAKLRAQLEAIRRNYGTTNASSSEISIEEMNQRFTAEQIDCFVEEISTNLEIALRIIDDSEDQRYKHNSDKKTQSQISKR